MIYPVGNGSKQDFEANWYIAQGFGAVTSYGYHEGLDINIKTGGDTDLGKEMKAIAKGRILYYHYAGHPTSAYGRHLVYKIDGAWGSRWVHYAHCLDTGFSNSVKDVSEGEVIAYLGKSGTPYAHLHMSIFKVDPSTIGGIDIIARNLNDLNAYWEDPLAFMNKWTQVVAPPAEPIISDPKAKIDFQGMQTPIETYGVMELQLIKSKILSKDSKIKELEGKISAAKSALG